MLDKILKVCYNIGMDKEKKESGVKKEKKPNPSGGEVYYT
jgi:hypothetical protein